MTVYFAFTLPGTGQRFHCLVWSFSHWIFPRATFSASKQTYNPAKTNRGDKRYGSESLSHPKLEVRVFRGISFIEQKNPRTQYISRAGCHAQCSTASGFLSMKQESSRGFLSSSIWNGSLGGWLFLETSVQLKGRSSQHFWCSGKDKISRA